MSNEHLHNAKRQKNDEYYTRYADIEKEISHYRDQLEGKWVYSPCDDYRWSNFPKYFVDNFHHYGLKHYTCTNYDLGDGAFRFDYDGVMGVPITWLDGYYDGYEIVGLNNDSRTNDFKYLVKGTPVPDKNGVPRFGFFCKGKQVYTRILIRRKK